jgi:hypothetical protein
MAKSRIREGCILFGPLFLVKAGATFGATDPPPDDNRLYLPSRKLDLIPLDPPNGIRRQGRAVGHTSPVELDSTDPASPGG